VACVQVVFMVTLLAHMPRMSADSMPWIYLTVSKKVEEKAVKLGYPRLRDTKGKGTVTGIGQHFPSIIELIKETLNMKADYRFLSSIAHGHHPAMITVSFKTIEALDSTGKKSQFLEKYVDPPFILYLASVAVASFSSVLWHVWKIHGWNMHEIENLLAKTYDQLQHTAESRFWVQTNSPPATTP
jgi:hypothetical protein